jgi:factor associated with neutral sphingomyelinase activation
VRAREDAVSFDTSRLCDFSERVRLEVPAMQLTPLIRERGQLVVSETRVYFQPLHNISGR